MKSVLQSAYISAALPAATLCKINAMLNPLPTRSSRAWPDRENPAWPHVRTLAVDGVTRMAYRVLGQPEGNPWLVLHGGPGSGCHPGMLRPFDLARQLVIAPDQRGSGLSSTRGSTLGNSTPRLVADLEKLRLSLGIKRWSILAGSWGTVLALRYVQAHPHAVQGLLMRGTFGLRRREIEGVLVRQATGLAGRQMPQTWPRSAYANASTTLGRLAKVLQVGAPSVAGRNAIRFWSQQELARALKGQHRARLHLMSGFNRDLANEARAVWAGSHRQLRRAQAQQGRTGILATDRQGWQKFRLQAHYLRHQGYTRPNDLTRAVLSLAHHGIDSTWIHGRFDTVCPVANSRDYVELLLRQPGTHQVDSQWPDAGHLGGEPGIHQQLSASLREQKRETST